MGSLSGVVRPLASGAAEAGDAALLLPRLSRQTSLTPLNLESWNRAIAAAHASSVL